MHFCYRHDLQEILCPEHCSLTDTDEMFYLFIYIQPGEYTQTDSVLILISYELII